MHSCQRNLGHRISFQCFPCLRNLLACLQLIWFGIGLVASLRPDGWWLSAWVAGVLAILLGIVSVVYPGVESSLGLGWALVAIAWGIVFIAVAELTQNTEVPTLLGERDAISI